MKASPRLAQLGLSDYELCALRRQGFVYCKRRGRTTIFELRFRAGGRLNNVYAGSDRAEAEQLSAELRDWQRCRRHELAGKQLRRQVNRVRRDSNRRLAPVVETKGCRMHGSALRKIRRRSSNDRPSDTSGEAQHILAADDTQTIRRSKMELNGLPESIDLSQPPAGDRHKSQLDEQLAAVSRFRAEALKDEDPEIVVVGLLEANLAEIEAHVKHHFDLIPDAGAEDWEAVQEMQEATLEMHKPVVQQFGQLEELRAELKEANHRASRFPQREPSLIEIPDSEAVRTDENHEGGRLSEESRF
jgi:hypothetical protein